MNAETQKDSGNVLANLNGLLPDLESVYKDIHSHPELSMQENRTARIAADRLRAAGYEVTTGVGKTGVVGLLRNGDGPTIMLRADMDALPVKEATGLPYASSVTATDSDGKNRARDARLRSRHARHLADRRGHLVRTNSGCMARDADACLSAGRGDSAGRSGDD